MNTEFHTDDLTPNLKSLTEISQENMRVRPFVAASPGTFSLRGAAPAGSDQGENVHNIYETPLFSCHREEIPHWLCNALSVQRFVIRSHCLPLSNREVYRNAGHLLVAITPLRMFACRLFIRARGSGRNMLKGRATTEKLKGTVKTMSVCPVEVQAEAVKP